ncbi:hypothetical protein [Candidatus Methanocrinis natronophilus]|uniref:Uncharacterized protein n=1 Tax=Candidatus Methanocrinis natronophilus TaxID=3033396 RepID=A0ABT5X757_9EURY|nr:hypothetical protein [Candidatus Methanocrinis natronophilus]MDF0590534.1 hypothetical protein [Candidatus Methanocrinis natronophilus]
MGRTCRSVRMRSHDLAARWPKASWALSKEDQIYGQRLAEMVMDADGGLREDGGGQVDRRASQDRGGGAGDRWEVSPGAGRG